MIYPTRPCVLAALIGAPLALVAALMQPNLWLAAPGWLLGLGLLMVVDAVLAAPARSADVRLDVPGYLAVAAPSEARLIVDFGNGRAVHQKLEAALDAEARVGLEQSRGRRVSETEFAFPLKPERRGTAIFNEAIVRWRGPLGLIWRQTRRPLPVQTPVGSDIRRIEDEALRMFSRDDQHGAKVQLDVGEGAEFHALRDFHSGMDRRTVDWKQSARHHTLLAKEFRIERNHQVVMALDCGRTMSEPVDGAPRIDRAIHGALILAYASLRGGDRAGLFAFDGRPRLSTGAVTGVGAFPLLVRQAANIDYGTEETNYAFGLTSLSATLKRRSLIVIFTEFADSTSAELMIESVGRLIRKHLVLFVVMRDDELEGLVSAVPETPEDVSRAVVAATLLRERDVVLGRLRRLGAHIVEAPADRLGPEALNVYLDLKRRDLL
ncbi:DUF58 domain-containing protein [Brevundimonas sp. NPDC092305]|uniref:DUF58 domain-containing protein n=1 Tax=Brevundimonas sp. NPDC092305 TaxID=3363957 RepID=UPI003811930A